MAHFLRLLVAIASVAYSRAIPLQENDFSIARAAPATKGDPKLYRLPSDVVPESYNITLTPHLESDDFTFTGVSKIKIIAMKNTKQITLHAYELNITMAVLHTSENSTIPATPLPLNKTNDFLIINLGSPLIPKAKYTLELHYEGELRDDLTGFYRSSYVDDRGATRWLATTQFEPTYARRAFPCWDEPQLKSTFDIAIVHSDKLRAISNTLRVATKPVDASSSITIFSTTPKMSTYLVAFVVSDFSYLENKDGSFKIWARPNAYHHGEFALDVGEKELRALENFTNIIFANHGFPKMDSIAIPQFAAGAMENWGLVTYRESALLVNENVTTTASKEGVATVITHEFAHQWFGDLVSPKWWQYTWLNEGFATYFQYVITDQILPEWRLKDLQVIKALQSSAFVADSVSTAVEMNYDVNSPAEIKAKFNSISYQKAGSVIRMIKYVIGEDKFKAALQAYLNARQFDVATSDDLFKEMIKVTGNFSGTAKDPLTILNNWANTPGFPLINVTRNYATGAISITQERYLYKPDANHTEAYYVPINYALKKEDFNDTNISTWLEPAKPITNLNVSAPNNSWIVVNKQHFGYYRVNYDEKNWQLIAEFLRTKNYTDIHVLNRGQLVDDALNLARNGKLRYKVALDLLDFLTQDFDYVPWSSALTGLSILQIRLANTESYSSFKAHILRLLEPVVKNVTFDESPKDVHLTKYLRIEVLHWACRLGSKVCRDQAALKMTNWLADSAKNPIPANLKSVVLCAGIRSTNEETWNKLFAKYSAGEENALLAALGCSSNTTILNKYLSAAMNASLSATNRNGIFTNVISNTDEGVNVALDFILANAEQIYQLSKNSTEHLKTYITAIGSRITGKAQLEKLKKANSTHIRNIFDEAVSNAENSLDWLANHEPQIKEYYYRPDKNQGGINAAVTVSISSVSFAIAFVISQLH